jgi:hypothetical protein
MRAVLTVEMKANAAATMQASRQPGIPSPTTGPAAAVLPATKVVAAEHTVLCPFLNHIYL